MLKFRILIIFIASIYFNTLAQKQFFTHSLLENIKTIQIYNSKDILSQPVIQLNSNETITLSFDELSDSEQMLNYTIIHCNSKWEPSQLIASEYVNGFKQSNIDEYEYSFNTNIPYVNYRLTLPNSQTSFKISGNYAIVVNADNSNAPILIACFYVTENAVSINPTIKFVTETDINNENQQIEFTINHPFISISDPNTELNVKIQQNNRLDNIKSNILPTAIHSGKLIYERNKDLIFKGGNEFRYFEATSTRYNTHAIESIQYHTPYYHMVLVPDEAQSKLSYSYHHDVNGRFFIRKQEADQDYLHIESDYVFIHFTLPIKEPFFDGKIYLNGDFTHNQFIKEYQLTYDFDEKVYYTNLLLKQGRYDYQYLFLPTGGSTARYTPLENNFFETENEYQIFCYYRPFGEKYERLIGYTTVNANAKNANQ